MSELDLASAQKVDSQEHTFGFGVREPSHPELTAGAMLRRGREAAGVHLGAMAVALKVPVKKLEALEEDRLDLLPDAVFARALASSVCRNLKLDVAPVLERLPQTVIQPLRPIGGGMNTPFRSPGESSPSLLAQVSRPAVLAGMVFLLGALVLIFLPAITQDGAPASVDSVGASDSSPTPSAESAGSSPAEVITSVENSSAIAPLAAASSAVSADSSLASAAPGLPVPPAVNLTSATPAGLVANPSVAAPPADGIVVFRATGNSWVEVVDAKGAVVLRRTLAPGELASAAGALPLAVVVGKADVIQVQVRGKAFDMTPVVKDNVARFEVK